MNVAARSVRLQIEVSTGAIPEVVSAYWSRQLSPISWSLTIGDLLSNEERHAVVRFRFTNSAEVKPIVRARLLWTGPDGTDTSSSWQEVTFEQAAYSKRAAEPVDRSVQRIVGQHHAERAQREAIVLSRRGDLDGARQLLRKVAGRIANYAGSDVTLQQALADLRAMERQLEQSGYQSAAAKEAYFHSQNVLRGQRDLRASRN